MERLWQVVVRAHFKADDAVDRLSPAGQNDDPDGRLIAQRSSEGQSVLAWQHQIEDDEIDRFLGYHSAHPCAIMCSRDPVALARQIFLDEIVDLALIVDDQNVTVVVLAGQLRLPFAAVRLPAIPR